MYINTMFPNAKSYASEKNARKKLDEVCGPVTPGSPPHHFHTVVVQRADGRFTPVVIVGRDCEIPTGYFAHSGVCVTNI